MVLLTEALIGQSPVKEIETAKAFATWYGVHVPGMWERPLKRFAWSAKAHRYLNLVDDNWQPGTIIATLEARYGDWTFTAIVQRAAHLLLSDEDPFDQLAA